MPTALRCQGWTFRRVTAWPGASETSSMPQCFTDSSRCRNSFREFIGLLAFSAGGRLAGRGLRAVLDQPADLAPGKQESANSVDLGGGFVEFLWIRADGLHVGELAVAGHAAGQAPPRLHHRRRKFFALKQTLVDAPGERVAIESGAARFLEPIIRRIEQAGAPESVGLLAGEDLVSHGAILLEETGARGRVGREVLQHAHQAGHDPAVAPAPKDFFPVGLAPLKVGTVAKIEMFVAIEEEIRGLPPVRDGKIKVGLFARRRI